MAEIAVPISSGQRRVPPRFPGRAAAPCPRKISNVLGSGLGRLAGRDIRPRLEACCNIQGFTGYSRLTGRSPAHLRDAALAEVARRIPGANAPEIGIEGPGQHRACCSADGSLICGQGQPKTADDLWLRETFRAPQVRVLHALDLTARMLRGLRPGSSGCGTNSGGPAWWNCRRPWCEEPSRTSTPAARSTSRSATHVRGADSGCRY